MSDWRDDAACRSARTELFFPQSGEPGTRAKAICAKCEVRQECLEFALGHRMMYGIWGGTSERERQRLRTRLRVREYTADCGTVSGYKRHRRLSESACEDCRVAAARYQQRLRGRV